MTDQTSSKDRLVAAALRLAAERPWREVTLQDVAAAAGLTLPELRALKIGSTADLLAAFTRQIDDRVLANARRPDATQPPRDAIFDVLMARFDALQPYRKALRSIVSSGGPPDPGMMRTLLASQHWMLAAAGIKADGVKGAVKTAGLASVYASAFRTWLDDDDPGMARTMATLDRKLRRVESTLLSLRDFEKAVCRVACALRPGKRAKSASENPAEPPSAASAAEHPMPS